MAAAVDLVAAVCQTVSTNSAVNCTDKHTSPSSKC